MILIFSTIFQWELLFSKYYLLIYVSPFSIAGK